MPRQITPRNVSFFLITILTLAVFFVPLKQLLEASWHNELYSHIILIPLISGYFLYVEKKYIFSNSRYGVTLGIGLIAVSTLLYLAGTIQGGLLDQNDHLSLMTSSAVTFWIGGFVLCYGIQVFRRALFPLLFLVFMIPIPTSATEQITFFLQSASADAAYGFFKLTGVPVFREGFLFQLPGINIEVAEQCSGIRSTLALFITSILAGHLFLQTSWRKIVLTLSIVPIAILKNGLRIVTLSLLGTYVDERILTDSILHREGGIPIFILALGVLSGILWLLRKGEKNPSRGSLEKTGQAVN